ncbi:MAG: Hpt domain-containing protein [Atopobiaceae bacterium]|nr:Hpt domain-containing protein [Atopobiaceae bacterium]
MTVAELYDQIGGSYNEVKMRLPMDPLVSRFVIKFLHDPSSEQLIAAGKAGDEEALFKAAHAVKGVCANLAITRLADLASQITEATREGNEAIRANTNLDELVAQFEVAYGETAAAIRAFEAQQG